MELLAAVSSCLTCNICLGLIPKQGLMQCCQLVRVSYGLNAVAFGLSQVWYAGMTAQMRRASSWHFISLQIIVPSNVQIVLNNV